MHLVFIFIHGAALLFLPIALFITIPAHLIAGASSNKKPAIDPERPTPDTHVRCPDCKELVRKDATVCKHCRCALIPLP
jgi:hypothetical protein